MADGPWTSLYEIVKQHKSRYLRYKTDEKGKENGPTVLRLPPYQCDSNPIEIVWSQIKQYTKARNTTFKIKDADVLMREAITHVTAEQLDNYCQHVLKVEKEMWRLDMGCWTILSTHLSYRIRTIHKMIPSVVATVTLMRQ